MSNANVSRSTNRYILQKPDNTGNSIIIPALPNNKYADINADITMALNVGSVVISIFSDSTGTVYAKDSNGNDINSVVLTDVYYSNPYVNFKNVEVPGAYMLVISGGSTISNNDDSTTEYWYFVQGINDITSLRQL